MSKEILFSVTASDCEWSYTRGSGKGGQKRNKTSSAVHCMHRPSGAHGYSEASRSQLDNKRDAFKKMAETKEFKNWMKIESARKMGTLKTVEETVERELKRAKVEVRHNGKWIDAKEYDKLMEI